MASACLLALATVPCRAQWVNVGNNGYSTVSGWESAGDAVGIATWSKLTVTLNSGTLPSGFGAMAATLQDVTTGGVGMELGGVTGAAVDGFNATLTYTITLTGRPVFTDVYLFADGIGDTVTKTVSYGSTTITLPSVSQGSSFALLPGQPQSLLVTETINVAVGGEITHFENQFNVVPEPSTMLAGALLLLPFGASTVRILRRNRTA